MSEDFNTKLRLASEQIQKFTYPLLTLDRNKLPLLFASCVFLRVGKDCFLVTAAHALRTSPTNLWTRGRDKLIQVRGRGTVSRSDAIDHFDIGAVLVDDQFIQQHGIETVPITNLSLAVEVSNPHCRAICGFP